MKIKILANILLALAIFPVSNTWAGDITAVMDRVNTRYMGEDYEGTLQLKQTAKTGRQKTYLLTTKSLKEQGSRKNILKFIKPGFMRHSGVLLHNDPVNDNLQWLYLSKASRSQARRISSSEKGQPLFGTDVAYIDIEEKKTEDFQYQLIDADAQGLMVVAATPKEKDYPYSKTVSWVNTDTLIEEKIEYYQDNKLVKRYQAHTIDTIDNIPTVVLAEVISLTTDSRTEMRLQDLRYNVGLGDKHFTLNALTKSR